MSPFCEFCGEELSYLPFKCKYCAGTYCSKHRLPENHECSFEIKHKPISPHTTGESRPLYRDTYLRPDVPKKRYREHPVRTYDREYTRTSETSGTTTLMLLIIIMSIIAVFIPLMLCLNLYTLSQLFLWTIFTSLFVSYSSGIIGLFFLFIYIFFFYNIARSVEINFGTKFLIRMYFFCAFFSGLVYVLISLLLALTSVSPIDEEFPSVGLATGAILGLIAFIIFLNPNREATILCFFIPVKMKGRLILIILILFRLIPGLLFGLVEDPAYFAVYLPDLGGVLAAYLVFYQKYKYR